MSKWAALGPLAAVNPPVTGSLTQDWGLEVIGSSKGCKQSDGEVSEEQLPCCTVENYRTDSQLLMVLQDAASKTAIDTLEQQHQNEVSELLQRLQQQEVSQQFRDGEIQTQHARALHDLKADNQQALDLQAAQHKSVTDVLVHQHSAENAELKQQLLHQQRDENIREKQTHSQHARILDDFKAERQSTLDLQSAAHLAAADALEKRHRAEVGRLEQQLQQQASEHDEKLEKLSADKDHVHEQLCNDAAQLKCTLLRDHKSAIEAKDKILAEKWHLFQDQTRQRNWYTLCQICQEQNAVLTLKLTACAALLKSIFCLCHVRHVVVLVMVRHAMV